MISLGGFDLILDPSQSKNSKGSFTNYIDKILPILDQLTIPCWHLWRNSYPEIRENLHTIEISITNYFVLPLIKSIFYNKYTLLHAINTYFEA